MSAEKPTQRTIRKTLGTVALIAIILAAFALGYHFAGFRQHEVQEPRHTEVASVDAKSQPEKKTPAERKKVTIWVGAMHPQIKSTKPGKCPICGMDLVPVEVEQGGSDSNLVRHTMSEAAKRLAQVETTEVKRESAKVKLRMVGLVFEDETRVASLTSRVDGRLDEVYVDFTGVQVRKGDPMVTIWSPTLIRSQVELFETIRSPEYGESVVKGAEEKLKQLGLTDDQIQEIREKRKPDLYVTLRAPISGIVMKRNVVLGDFVKEGTVMYEITDLSKVWVKLDAYETDLPWIRYGQEVTFTTPAVPGTKFKGQVVFIDPMLQMATRSVKIRVEADNPDLKLKPNMFVTAEVEAEVDYQGRVIKSDWVGKYMCPLHPSEVSTEPGICPRSKQERRPPEAFGYASGKNPALPLVIPASAVLYTGKRSVVYVEVPHEDMPTYELREVVLGPRAGDKYVVYDGLIEGERVVTKGNFKIDSAAQLLAKPSMMNPARPSFADYPSEWSQDALLRERLHLPRSFGKALSPVFAKYLDLKQALAGEHAEAAANHAKKLIETVRGLDVDALEPKAHSAWKRLSGKMLRSLEVVSQTPSIHVQREAFRKISEIAATVALGAWPVIETPIYLYRCRTAFGEKGAYWLEGGRSFENPYTGKAPSPCGELVSRIPPEGIHADGKARPSEVESRSKDVSHRGEGSHTKQGSETSHESHPGGSHSKSEHETGSHSKSD